MTTPNDIVEAILTGQVAQAQELFSEAVATSVKQKIEEQRSVVAAEVFGTAIVEKCDDDKDSDKDDKKPPFGKKDDDKDDSEKDSDKDSDKEDKGGKKPPFGKKED